MSSIQHIESLPNDKFIETVKSISSFVISEKLDGSNLVFGFDNDGRFYTSREAKNKYGNRYYSVGDYSDRAFDNGFKSAHAALERLSINLRKYVRPGEAIETEILFGRQPNAIVYGSNYIAFLRAVPGDNDQVPDQEIITRLNDEYKDIYMKVTVPITTTSDGLNIDTEVATIVYFFASVPFVDSKLFAAVDVEEELESFEQWLELSDNIANLGLKNRDLIAVNLNTVAKVYRPEVKRARDNAIQIANKFKLIVKEKFLDGVLRKITPALRDVEVEPHEDLGIEGVVLLNPETLEQIKIVDKDVFTTINQFNHAVRNQIKFAVGKRPEFETGLPVINDVYGDMLEMIEAAIGLEGVGRYASIKRTLRQYAGKDEQQTIKNVVEQLKSTDAYAVKRAVHSALKAGYDNLGFALFHYQLSWKNLTARLKTGVDVKYTDEIHNRTLMVFAEVRQELQDMLYLTYSAGSLDDIILALFGKQIKEIHN